MTPTTSLIAIQALTIVLLVLRLRRQFRRMDVLATKYNEAHKELERLEWIYLGKRPWVKGWL